MARRTPHLSDSFVTISNVALHNNGLNLYCLDCNHNAAWSPCELAAVEPPARLVWDFKRRRRCSKCGARGSTDRVYLTSFVVNGGVASWGRSPDPTAPQLWHGWARFAGTPPQRLCSAVAPVRS